MKKTNFSHLSSCIEELLYSFHPQSSMKIGDQDHLPFLQRLAKYLKNNKSCGISSTRSLHMILKQLHFEESFEQKRLAYKRLITFRLIIGLFILVIARHLLSFDSHTSTLISYVTCLGACLLLFATSHYLLLTTPQSWFLSKNFDASTQGVAWLEKAFQSPTFWSSKDRLSQWTQASGISCREYLYFQCEAALQDYDEAALQRLNRAIARLPLWEGMSLGTSALLAFWPYFIAG